MGSDARELRFSKSPDMYIGIVPAFSRTIRTLASPIYTSKRPGSSSAPLVIVDDQILVSQYYVATDHNLASVRVLTYSWFDGRPKQFLVDSKRYG